VCTSTEGDTLACSILSQPYTPPSVIQALYAARQLELEEAGCLASGTLSGNLLYTSFKDTSINLAKIHLEQRLKCEQVNLNADTSRLIQAINSRVEQLRLAWTPQDQDSTRFDALLTLLVRQELKHKTESSGSSRIASFLDVPFQLSSDMSKQRIRRHSASGYTKGSTKNLPMSVNIENCDAVEMDSTQP
jgi:hypothetical protein